MAISITCRWRYLCWSRRLCSVLIEIRCGDLYPGNVEATSDHRASRSYLMPDDHTIETKIRWMGPGDTNLSSSILTPVAKRRLKEGSYLRAIRRSCKECAGTLAEAVER
jgi:hypothetical protein